MHSPLRYPGGKSRLAPLIGELIMNESIKEFREPMVGGGSVFLYIHTLLPDVKYIIGDKDPDVANFWLTLRDKYTELIQFLLTNKDKLSNVKSIKDYKWKDDELSLAAKFYVYNRSSFSGLTYMGGLSEDAVKERFTKKSINALHEVSRAISNVEIECADYCRSLLRDGKDVILYLDPPYYNNSESKLYKTHKDFDHNTLAIELRICKHKWMLSYDNAEKITNLYKQYNIMPVKVQYGMDNVGGKKSKLGQEILIMNFEPGDDNGQ
jgi:DNA adenine methylase